MIVGKNYVDIVKKIKSTICFFSYLRRVTPEPDHKEEYYDFHEDIPEERGWNHIPAGFNSIHEYWN